MSSSSLSEINSRTLGTQMPTVTLPDGTTVQTGTIGALLINIKTYDELSAANYSDDPETQRKLAELEARFRAAILLMRRVGLLELFRPEEWMRDGGGGSVGRRRVGELAIEFMDEKGEGEGSGKSA